jgi:hypothetical protein
MAATSMPLRVSVHDVIEFEFHISPVANSSRPHHSALEVRLLPEAHEEPALVR